MTIKTTKYLFDMYTPHTVWVGGPPIRKRGKAWRKDSIANKARDMLILGKARAGESMQNIADQMGLSIGRCYEIVKATA